MKKAILATKVGMTQVFNEGGELIPVTVLSAGPCVVTQIKTVENDGYDAVQVGFVDKKQRRVTSIRLVLSQRDLLESSDLTIVQIMHLLRKSKLTSLKLVTRLMQQLLQRARDSRALSRD